jgi:hypothetical protein
VAKTLTPEEVRKVLANALSAIRSQARLSTHLTVADVKPLTKIINGFIAHPWSDEDVEDWFREDAEVCAYQDAIDDVGKLVNGILNRLEHRDRDGYNDACEHFWHILEEMDRLRPLLGEPRFKPHERGPFPEGRTFMSLKIADEALLVLRRVAYRCGARLQDSFGKKGNSPILTFTIAMRRLILPGEKPPSPKTLARRLEAARAWFQVAPE